MCLLAEAAPKDAPAAQPAGGMAGMLLPIIAIFFLFYFILLRPQKREQSRRKEMLDGIKKNDHVLTAGGIYGVVVSVHREANEVTIKVDEATNTVDALLSLSRSEADTLSVREREIAIASFGCDAVMTFMLRVATHVLAGEDLRSVENPWLGTVGTLGARVS